MPPRVTKKKATTKDVGAVKTIDEHALDVELGEIDMKVDEWKSELEHEMEETIAAMKRIVDEYSGHSAYVLDKEKKMNKLARTVAKSGPSSAAARVATLLKGTARVSRLGPAVGAVLGETTGEDKITDDEGSLPAAKVARLGLSSVASGRPMQTPTASKLRSVLGPAAPLPAQTPKMNTMKSCIAAPTPMLNPLLPKTPAVRRPRRGEVLYAISANGSPVGQVNVDREVRGSMAVKQHNGVSGPMPSSSAELQIDMGDGGVVEDEESVLRMVAERGADAVLASIEAMAAKVEALRAAATAASKGLPMPSTVMHTSKISRTAHLTAGAP